jgi:acetyltransferase-like isoleucine patch superfamily enzyme
MLKSNFILNPIRSIEYDEDVNLGMLKRSLRTVITMLGLWAGFPNIDYSYIHGKKSRLHLGADCSTMNSIFNVISGHIYLGDHTIVGHNCMFLTGTHNFIDGKRISLSKPDKSPEVPKNGRDIVIGKGCFIGSGVTIVGPVNVGDNVLIAAGSVVTKDIGNNSFAAGVPAKVIENHT